MPDPTQAERNARLTMQLGLQLSQRQIGFRCHPIHHLSLRRDTGTPLAPGLVPHPLGLPGAVPLCGDLLRPAHAHQEPIRKFLQRLLALIVSKQKLTAQVIPLWLRHRFTRRGSSPRQVYTIKKNALALYESVFVPPALALVLVFSLERGNLLRAFLRSRVVQAVGVTSYGIYLWQELFTAPATEYGPSGRPIAFLLPLLFVVVPLSYLFVEKPAMRLGRRLTERIWLGCLRTEATR